MEVERAAMSDSKNAGKSVDQEDAVKESTVAQKQIVEENCEGGSSGEASNKEGEKAEVPQEYMSKRQQKKLRKIELRKELKAKRKAELKEEKEQEKKEAREKRGPLSEEEIEAIRKHKKARAEENRLKNEEKKKKLKEALESGPRLVVDLDFEDKMSEKEIKSLCQQLGYCYSAVSKAAKPFHLWFTSMKGTISEHFNRQINSNDKWMISRDAGNWAEVFEKEKDKLVYLTADTGNVLSELNDEEIYIIGGLVDRNRHKGICKDRARDAGIRTAALPLKHELAGCKVLTTNQVVEIMCHYRDTGDWDAAFDTILPPRKRTSEKDGGEDSKRQKIE